MFSVSQKLHVHLLFTVVSLTLVSGLYEDQKGKFDWRKQFVGTPKFVYHHNSVGNLIIGTESNVVAALNIKDGSIIWRQLLPKGCNLDHLSILSSNEDIHDYIIRTSCSGEDNNLTHFWNPQNGLLATDARHKELAEEDRAESILSNQGHLVDQARAFTLSEDLTLLVAEDGSLTLNSQDSVLWSREESLASVTAVQIVKLPVDIRDRFGLKKLIVTVSENGKIFGLDTITSEIRWTLFERDISTRGLSSPAMLIIGKESDDGADASRAIIIHPQGLVVSINPITGKVIDKRKLCDGIKQIAQTEADNEAGRGVIILDKQDAVHVYPSAFEGKVKANIDKYYITIAEKRPAIIEGYKFAIVSNSIVPVMIWSLPINETETMVSLSIKRIDETSHSPARVLGDRGILYKYLNPNLIAVMTQGSSENDCSPEYYVNVYLIDGVTGALVHSAHHPKGRAPAAMVHSENWLVYSYYNTKTRRNEVSSLEMYEGTQQTNSSTFSSLTRSSIKPKLVEHKSFIFPGGIDAMVDTVTLRGMTNRHIIVALPTGGLLEIPKIFLDPRRPINMLTEHREEGLIPYMPELPIPSESMINYDQTLMAVRGITTSPAMLESTSLVFTYGLDLFFTRVTPSKTFDILKDDFDHVLISGVLVFLVIASYACKLLAQRKALRAAWK